MSNMAGGKVEYGAINEEDGKFIPFIAFKGPKGKHIEFRATGFCDSEEAAYNIASMAYLILSGPQTNVQHARGGIDGDGGQ